jgi:hypothetical protein
VEPTERADQGVELLEVTQAQGTQGLVAQEGAAATDPPYVFAVGQVQPTFPTLGVEKEYSQRTGRAQTDGLTDRQALQRVLSDRENRYLVRQMCFVFTIGGLDAYILQPRDPVDFELLVEAIRPEPSPTGVDVVIGIRGPIAPPEACNGLMVPLVAFDQLYSFDVETFIESIPRPEDLPEDQQERFRATAKEVFMQMTDNEGATDEHRAINYLAVRHELIYARTAEQFGGNFSLSGVEARPSPMSGATRSLIDVVFTYTHRETNVVEKYSARVDASEENPFLVTPMSPYYER